MAAFCSWVNEVLLVNNVLEPGYPRKVSVATALLWLLSVGFQVIKKKKGTYVDGHERADVIDYQQKFLTKMDANGKTMCQYPVLKVHSHPHKNET